MQGSESEVLLAAAQSGNRAALERLLLENRQHVYRYGLRVCRTSEDAEDAVQETLWAATRSITTFRRAASISTWLFTIVRNYCIRSRARGRFYADLDYVVPEIADTALSPEDEVATGKIRAILVSSLAQLDAIHREVILLRDVEGLTTPEAAQKLGITVMALKSRLHRARELLRSFVAQAD